MSVYSFGKIISHDNFPLVQEEVQQLAKRCNVEVRMGLLDNEDDAILQESSWLRGEGVVFNLFSPSDSDIGTLWEEAFSAGRDAVRSSLGETTLPKTWEQACKLSLPESVYTSILETRLGRFVDGLFQFSRAKGTGFAIFDSGVDQIIEETAFTCKLLILRSLLVAWDMGPNALFVWKSHAAVPPESKTPTPV